MTLEFLSDPVHSRLVTFRQHYFVGFCLKFSIPFILPDGTEIKIELMMSRALANELVNSSL